MLRLYISALDGEVGSVKDIYFDETSWKIQYLVIKLGSFFSEKVVLVPPSVVAPFEGHSLNIELTKNELKECLHADDLIPETLQERYVGKSLFNMMSMSGNNPYGGPVMVYPFTSQLREIGGYDPHLRSCKVHSKYTLEACSSTIGTVEDFLVDDSLWALRFVIINLSKECEREKKMIDLQSIEVINDEAEAMTIGLTIEEITKKTTFDASLHIDTSYENLLKNMY
jgi:hypothetical protein